MGRCNRPCVRGLIDYCLASTLSADAVDPETPTFTAWASGYPNGPNDCVVTYVKVQSLNPYNVHLLSHFFFLFF